MDHSITVAPGSEFPVQAAGDFVFCKFADRDIRVIIQNSPRTMRAGSKWRPAGGFEAGDVIVQNPDTVNPVAVVLTIGVGDFDDQIIHGEVTVNPGIRGRDGVFIDDTRSTVRLSAAFGNIKPREYLQGQQIAEVSAETYTHTAMPSVLDDGRVLTCDDDGKNWALYRNWPSADREPLIRLGHGKGVQVGAELVVPQGESVPGLGDRVVLIHYDAATLQFREKTVTGAMWNSGNSGNPAVYALEYFGGRYFIGQGGGSVDVVDVDGAFVDRLIVESVGIVRGLVVSL